MDVIGVEVRDNLLSGGKVGIQLGGTALSAKAQIHGNTIRKLDTAIFCEDGAAPTLGNLGNSATNDDGDNRFRDIAQNFVINETPNRIKAEGNDFGITSKAAIDAKIIDFKDDHAYGRVDFDPLKGGVIPTGAADGVLVASGAALSTATGAEIVFSLSAQADVSVSVVNIAGRPVANVQRARPSEPGLQRVLWSGRSDAGTMVPAGTYLVRIAARSADGAEASVVTPLRLAR